MAALALFALTSFVLYGALAACLQNMQRATDISDATSYGESLLDTLGAGEPLPMGTSEGQFDPRYRWQLKVEPLPTSGAAGAPGQGLYAIRLEVVWGDRESSHRIRLNTLRTVVRPDRTDRIAEPGT